MSLTRLMVAAKKGNLEGVRENLGVAGNQDKNGCTALMRATFYGNLECAQLLLSEVGMQDNGGETALMMATMRGHSNIIPLLEKEIGMQDKGGWTALMLAAVRGHANCIPLLERELGMQRDNGWTALMEAAYNGKTDCALLLLSEVGKQSTKAWEITPPWSTTIYPSKTTALMLAACNNHPEIVELLLPYEQGLKDSEGHTAKWYANNSELDDDFTQVRELLENEGSNCLPPPKEECMLMMSAVAGDVEGVRKHLDRVGYENLTGVTALMMAAKNGRASCISLLESEMGMRDNFGRTALMWASFNGEMECAKLLISEAVMQTTKQWNDFHPGTTALMMAAMGGHSSIIPLLEMEFGMQDEHGWTSLMYAAWRGHTTCIPLLEKELRMRNMRGETALLLALQEGRVECARLLADEAAAREENGQLHIERIRRLVREEEAKSTLAETYRAVKDDLGAAVMPHLLKKLAPHHIKPLLSLIDQLFEDMDAQELGEAVWSMLFCEHGALEGLDDILYDIEGSMVDPCIVCLSRQKDAVLMPCRHLVICEDCADQIEHCCPYCRVDVDDALVIEYPEGTSL